MATLARKGQTLRDCLALPERPSRVLALVGPEGDFTPEEAELASKRARMVSLGDLVLRAETAAMALVSNIRFYLREIR